MDGDGNVFLNERELLADAVLNRQVKERPDVLVNALPIGKEEEPRIDAVRAGA